MTKATLGLIVANRDGFPDFLCEEGRARMLNVLKAEGFDVVVVGAGDTPHGSVSTIDDARKCATAFKAHADQIDGILITLPNFGDEKAAANAVRWSGLNVPILVHAFPDDMNRMTIRERGDAFCGKISVCDNLAQYGYTYTLTSLHTVDPESDAFKADLNTFAATCRVFKGVRNARIGLLGARPQAFNTVRFSEKILEAEGISVETLDLSEAFGQANRLDENDPALKAKWEELRSYVETARAPTISLDRMARFSVVIDRWMAANQLNATALQCWSAMQDYYGIIPCTVMSMLSQRLMPSACETDVVGALSMLALQSASGSPSMLLDWNNNYFDHPDKCVVFHCSNLPKSAFACPPSLQCHPLLAEKLGEEQTFGQLHGRIKPGPFTFLRASTDDVGGKMSAYLGEAEFTDDTLDTFGGAGVVHVPGLQDLLYFICKNRFEHHVAANFSQVANAIEEALDNYLGWDVYFHE